MMRRQDWVLTAFCVLGAVLFLCMEDGDGATARLLMPNGDVRRPIEAKPYTDAIVSYHVRDGDSLTRCEIDLGYGIILHDSIRIAGVDTPELTGDQKEAGLHVRDAVERWLAEHDELWLIGRGRDKFGRILGDVQPPGVGQTLGEWLLEKRYAFPYDGRGKRPEWTAGDLERIVAPCGEK